MAAAFLLALLPLVLRACPPALVAVYALLVAYLVHQMEERYGDRFRRFVNSTVAGGADALTPRATMWINVGAVWGAYLVTLLLAGLWDVGFGLVAVYTTLVNARSTRQRGEGFPAGCAEVEGSGVGFRSAPRAARRAHRATNY